MRKGLIAAMLLTSGPVAAQAPQADYDAAQAAVAKGDSQAAAAKFGAVLARFKKAAPESRSLAIIRSQYAATLSDLGRDEEAVELYQLALPGLARPADKLDRALALAGLGRAEERRFDYYAAREAYRQAIAINVLPPADLQSMVVHFGLARTSMFSDHASRSMNAVSSIPDAEALYASAKDKLGEVYALRGEIELNDNKPAAAKLWLDKALAAAGGLTLKVSLSDIRIRADYALAAFALGERDTARKFIAYTGAGHMSGKQPDVGADMELPACGEDGVRPDDVAIVEFSILPDGSTTGIEPIQVSRQGIETAFARAVSNWSWPADIVEKLPSFWRHAMRLEIRCSTQQAVPQLRDSLVPAANRWLHESGGDLPEDVGTDAAIRIRLQADLDQREKTFGPNSPKLVAILYRQSGNAVTPSEDRAAAIRRALEIATAARAPAEVRALLALRQSELYVSRAKSGGYRAYQLAIARGPLAALAQQLGAEGAIAAHALAVVQAQRGLAFEQGHDFVSAGALYRTVVATPVEALPAHDPVRAFALLRLAAQAAQDRQLQDARRYFDQTGLSAEQCALVDVQPVRTGGTVTTADFPNEALRWGFDGWVQIGYDIDAAGHSTNVRTLLSYPPFIFGPATEKAVSRFRFQPLYRGGASVGCTGRTQGVRYQIPG